MEIKQVHVRKDGVKYLLLSKNGEFKKGDYVQVNKLEVKNGRKK